MAVEQGIDLMSSQFADYGLCLLAKNKGFNEPSLAIYLANAGAATVYWPHNLICNGEIIAPNDCTAILHQQMTQWLFDNGVVVEYQWKPISLDHLHTIKDIHGKVVYVCLHTDFNKSRTWGFMEALQLIR